MKKTSRFAILTALCILLAALSGCGGDSAKDFTNKASGVWQKNGNLQDMRLEILDDGSWTNKELKDGRWEITDKGIISYEKENKMFYFQNDNKYYPVEYSSSNGEILHYKNDNYYRAEKSMDGFKAFDGRWYKNGDRDSEYYVLENGEWKWFEPQGPGAVSVDSGNLAWNGASGRLLAYAYADGKVFASFDPSEKGKLIKDGVPYVFMEDLTADEIPSAGDDALMDSGSDPAESKFPIIIGKFYYLDGERGQSSFYFYKDGQVDYDDGDDGSTIEAVYSIDYDEIIIKTPEGKILGTLGIIDRSTLLDDDGEDIYAIAKD